MIALWLSVGLLARTAQEAVEPPVSGGIAPVNLSYLRAQKERKKREEEEQERLRRQLQAEAERLAAEALAKADEEHREEWRRELDRLVYLYPLPIEIRIDVSGVAQNIVAQWVEMQRRKKDEEEAISLILMLA